MDVHSLRVFATVAEELSLTRAGERLGLSQSAVSHQIAKLERETQCPLLDRGGRQVALTSAGEALLRHGSDVIARADALPALVRAAGAPGGGSLRIGASSIACQFLLPDPIRELRDCFANLALAVLPGDSPQITSWVAEGHVDVGVVVRGDKAPAAGKGQFVGRPLFRDRLGLVMNPSHPLAHAERLTANELGGQSWVLYTRASTTGRLIERHLERLRVARESVIELGAFEAIKELVKVGLGVGVMASWAVRDEVADGSLVWRPLPGPRLEREWSVVFAAGHAPTLIEETFADLCRRASRALADS